MTSQLKRNSPAEPAVITSLRKAVQECKFDVERRKRKEWQKQSAGVAKAGKAFIALLTDPSFPSDAVKVAEEWFEHGMDNTEYSNSVLHSYFMASLRALHELVFVPQLKVFTVAIMKQEKEQWSSDVKGAHEMLKKASGIVAQAAKSLHILDNTVLVTASQSSPHGCATMADVDFLLSFLSDLRGGAVDKGVAADELAQALYNIIQADCRSDDGPTLGVAMDLKQKQRFPKLLWESQFAGMSLHIARCVMFLVSPGTINSPTSSTEIRERQVAFAKLVKFNQNPIPSVYCKKMEEVIATFKRSYSKSPRDFMRLINILSFKRDDAPWGCPINEFLINDGPYVLLNEGHGAERLRAGEIILYLDHTGPRVNAYDDKDVESPVQMNYARIRDFKRSKAKNCTNQFSWKSVSPRDSSSYNTITVRMKADYADAFEKNMIRLAPKPFKKPQNSSRADEAMLSDGIERATTPTPGSRGLALGDDDDEDDRRTGRDGTDDSQGSGNARLDKLNNANRNYVDTPGTIPRGGDEDEDEEEEDEASNKGTSPANARLPPDHPALNPFSPPPTFTSAKTAPKSGSKALELARAADARARSKTASTPSRPSGQTQPSHVSDSLEETLTGPKAESGDATEAREAAPAEIAGADAVAKSVSTGKGKGRAAAKGKAAPAVVLRRSARQSSVTTETAAETLSALAQPPTVSTHKTTSTKAKIADKIELKPKATDKPTRTSRGGRTAVAPDADPSDPSNLSDLSDDDNDDKPVPKAAQAPKKAPAKKVKVPSSPAQPGSASSDTGATGRPSRAAKTKAKATAAEQLALPADPEEDTAQAVPAAEGVKKKDAKTVKAAAPTSKGKSSADAVDTSSEPFEKSAAAPKRSLRQRQSASPSAQPETATSTEKRIGGNGALGKVAAAPSRTTKAAVSAPANDADDQAQDTGGKEGAGAGPRDDTAGEGNAADEGGNDGSGQSGGGASAGGGAGGDDDKKKNGKKGNSHIQTDMDEEEEEEEVVEDKAEKAGSEGNKSEARTKGKAKQAEKTGVGNKEIEPKESMARKHSQHLEARKETAVSRSKHTYGSKKVASAAPMVDDLPSDEDDDVDQERADAADPKSGTDSSKPEKHVPVPAPAPVELTPRQKRLAAVKAAEAESKLSEKNSAPRKPITSKQPLPTLGQSITAGRGATPKGTVMSRDPNFVPCETRTRAGKPAGAVDQETSKPKQAVTISNSTASVGDKGKKDLDDLVNEEHTDDDSSNVGKTLDEIEAEEEAQRRATKGKGKAKAGKAAPKAFVPPTSSKAAEARTNDKPRDIDAGEADGINGVVPAPTSSNIAESVAASQPKGTAAAALGTSAPTKPASKQKVPAGAIDKPAVQDAEVLIPATQVFAHDMSPDEALVPTDTVEPIEGDIFRPSASRRADVSPTTAAELEASFAQGRKEGVHAASSMLNAILAKDPEVQAESIAYARREAEADARAKAKALAVADAEAEAEAEAAAQEKAEADLAAAVEAEAEAKAAKEKRARVRAEVQAKAEAKAKMLARAAAKAKAEEEAAAINAEQDAVLATPVKTIEPTAASKGDIGQRRKPAATVAPLVIAKGKGKDTASAAANALSEVLPPSSPLPPGYDADLDASLHMQSQSSPTAEIAAAIAIKSSRQLRRQSGGAGPSDTTPPSQRTAASNPQRPTLGLVARDSIMLLQDSPETQAADITLVDIPAIKPGKAVPRTPKPLKSAIKTTRFASQVEVYQKMRLAQGDGEEQESPALPSRGTGRNGRKRKSSGSGDEGSVKKQRSGTSRADEAEQRSDGVDARDKVFAAINDIRDAMLARAQTRFDLVDRTQTVLEARLVLKAVKEVKAASKQIRKILNPPIQIRVEYVNKQNTEPLQAKLEHDYVAFKTGQRKLKDFVKSQDLILKGTLNMWDINVKQ